MTWLANEDLDDGKCERCWSQVEQKPMKQRVLRITKYAERLLEWLDKLNWEESMKDLERNWISKSEGTQFSMNIAVPDKVSKIIILHGVTSHDQRHRFQRLKQEMSKQGVEVLIPNLPNTDNPSHTEQLAFLQKGYAGKLDENTIIIGHSLWCLLWAAFLLETGKKIKKLISTGPVFDHMPEIKQFPVTTPYIAWIKIDTKKLETLLDEHIVFISKTDPFIPYEKATEYYNKNFSKALLVHFDDKGHFSDKVGNLTEFPELLNYIATNNKQEFWVYTTRIDTVYGMSFVAIAPEHPLVDKITTKKYSKEVEKYKDAAKKKTQLERTELQKDKTWVFCWAYAINPFNNQKVPIFVADYVLANYGTWVVMAVPAHDERDFEFAKKYDLPITQSIMPIDQDKEPHPNAEIRHSVSAVIQRKSDGKFLFEKWKQFERISPVVGGIEWDENPFEAAEREVLEETWYTAKAIKKLWWLAESNFFAKNKNTRRQRIDQPILMELIHETPQKVDEEEFERLEPLRLTYGEAVAQTTHKNNLHGLHTFVKWESAFGEYGRVINSWSFTWLTSEEAIPAMQARLQDNWIWWVKVNYKMQDRVFSRQRYRGEPFPILRDEKWNIIPLDEKELPLTLPDVENYAPTGTTEWPLANITDWVNVTLPDGTKAKRETNTMPGRAGSSRYWLRYMDPTNDKALVGKDKEKYRGNVDVYIWWAEHVTRHMIYGRFWQKFLYDIGAISHDEPFQEYHYVGLIMGEDGRKMSKRRGNVVNPDDIISQFWADTLRTYEMFMWPFEQSIAWNTAWISGTKKFLDKISKLAWNLKLETWNSETAIKNENSETLTLLNQTIKKVTENIDEFKFNTAISQLMILTNHLTDIWSISRTTFETLVILVSPFAPHLAEELWEQLGNEYSIFTKATWPKYDEKMLVADTITIAVQVNGKVRGTISIDKDADQKQALDLAKADTKIAARIVNEPKKVIYVPGKILNIVV